MTDAVGRDRGGIERELGHRVVECAQQRKRIRAADAIMQRGFDTLCGHFTWGRLMPDGVRLCSGAIDDCDSIVGNE